MFLFVGGLQRAQHMKIKTRKEKQKKRRTKNK